MELESQSTVTKCVVTFKSQCVLKASIKIEVDAGARWPSFLHLPPVNRLKNLEKHAIYECLKNASRHSVVYHSEFDRDKEPRIIAIDGINLRPLWVFMDTKRLIFDQLQSSAPLSDSMLAHCEEAFCDYQVAYRLDFRCVRRLNSVLTTTELTLRDRLYPVSDACAKMLEQIYHDWFSELCSVCQSCVKATHMCQHCKIPLCGAKVCGTDHLCVKKSI